MSVTAVYTSLVDNRAARQRAGLPAALRHVMAQLLEMRAQVAVRKRAEQARRATADVRRLAEQMRASDPSMAADLDAAIDRQEVAGGIGG